MSKQLPSISLNPRSNMIEWIRLNEKKVSFEDFLEQLKDKNYGGKDTQSQYETFLKNEGKRRENAQRGLMQKFEAMKNEAVTSEIPSVKLREKEGFDYEKLTKTQKERFEGFVEMVMKQVKENRKTGAVRNPYSLKGKHVNQGGTSLPGTTYNEADIVKEARKRLLEENKGKIASEKVLVEVSEKLEGILNSGLDDESEKVAVDDLMEQAAKKLEKSKKELEKSLTGEEVADLEAEPNFSMANTIDFVLSCAILGVSKGGDVGDKIKSLVEKLGSISTNPGLQTIAKAAVGVVGALGGALSEGIPSNPAEFAKLAAKPGVAVKIFEFGKAIYGYPKMAGALAAIGGIGYLAWKYSDELFNTPSKPVGKMIGYLSFMFGLRADETKKLILNAYANITNTTVEDLENNTYGKVLMEILNRTSDEEIEKEKAIVANSTETKLLGELGVRLPTTTLLGIERGELNASNFLESLKNDTIREEMNTLIFGKEYTIPEPIVEPSTDLVVHPSVSGQLAPAQAPVLPSVSVMDKLNEDLIILPPEPELNNYTQKNPSNIMSFQTPYKNYDDLPEYMKVYITREEFDATMKNEGNINRLFLKKEKGYVNNMNGLLDSNLPRIPREKIPVRKEGRFLSSFPHATSNAPAQNVKIPAEQFMIGTGTELHKRTKKYKTVIAYGKSDTVSSGLIGTETALVRKVKKIPLY